MLITHIIEYASPIWTTLKSYLEDLLESIQRKALRIIFGKTEYADAMAMASFDTLKARRVVACQRFTLIVQQHPALMYVIPSLTFHECEYSLCSFDSEDCALSRLSMLARKHRVSFRF